MRIVLNRGVILGIPNIFFGNQVSSGSAHRGAHICAHRDALAGASQKP